MRGGAVITGAVTLAAVALSACGEGVPVIDTAPAEERLTQMVAAAGVPDETFVLLDDCLIADGQLLLERAFEGVDSSFLQLAFDADEVSFVGTPGQDPNGDPFVACGRLADDGIGVVLTVSDAPGDGVGTIDTEFDPVPGDEESDALRAASAAAHASRFGDPVEQITIDRGGDTRGGTFFRICIADPSRPERDSCEVAWFGGDLVVSAQTTGPGSLDVDLASVEERFRPLIQLVVDGLGTDG